VFNEPRKWTAPQKSLKGTEKIEFLKKTSETWYISDNLKVYGVV
jgi:hypothetical protein